LGEKGKRGKHRPYGSSKKRKEGEQYDRGVGKLQTKGGFELTEAMTGRQGLGRENALGGRFEGPNCRRGGTDPDIRESQVKGKSSTRLEKSSRENVLNAEERGRTQHR